ncbi:MAG: hypothetical protein JHD16_00800 [Solirubrobacteraceae bacterium]|nr:hypothetical protein [Solirubrobacteraceae bacterium]
MLQNESTPEVNRSEPRWRLAGRVDSLLRELAGEQYSPVGIDEDGDHYFQVLWSGVPVSIGVEQFLDEAIVTGIHIVGLRATDEDAVLDYVAGRNAEIRVGRVWACGDGVVFTHHLFESGVDRAGLRHLLNLLASESLTYGELQARTGALSVVDAAALHRLGGE